MDNTRPDFQTMYQLASEADDGARPHGRRRYRQELRRRLQRPKLEAVDPLAENKDDKLRLYFRSEERPFDPELHASGRAEMLRNRGPIEDLWDDGFVIWCMRIAAHQGSRTRCCWPLSAWLSLEWLTCKLLRLA